MRRGTLWGIAITTALSATGGVLALRTTTSARSGERPPTTDNPPLRAGPSERESELPKRDLRALRWIAAAGGATPELNQVSIEQDLGLASEVFAGPGYVLFAAGPDAPVVQVLDALDTDPVRAELAEFFAPRGGRRSTYRPPEIRVDAPATGPRLLSVLRAALTTDRQRDDPLLLYLAGHGHQGEGPADAQVGFWGYTDVGLSDLGRVLDIARRPVRIVMTTCFSGGFAELAFRFGDPGGPGAYPPRCGLFSAPWDLESSGCDPNPDRRAQEGFGVHFLEALRGRDREGRPLPPDSIDFDGDGIVSLLEAHARVRIASKAPDVPTTTSERWLRAKADELPRAKPWSSPENDAVIEALVRQLGLAHTEGRVRTRLRRLETRIEQLAAEASEASLREDQAFRAASAELLAKWPVLDDPWHPQFEPTFEHHKDAIAAHLDHSERYASYLAARSVVDELAEAMAGLRRRAAPLERLIRALDNRDLAGRLRASGGRNWTYYEALLECERYNVPTSDEP